MDKNQILLQVKTLVSANLLTKDELLKAYDEAQENKPRDVLNIKIGVAESLYYIGGLIVFIGIVVLVFQNWESLDTFMRIFVTLGSGIAAFVVGLLLGLNKDTDPVGYAFHLIAALILPLGIFISFDAAGIEPYSAGYMTIIFSILFFTYLASFFLLKKLIFIIFTIIFGSFLYFTLTNFILGSSPLVTDWSFNEYRVLVLGISYILLGYAFSKTDMKGFSGALYGFGVLGVLASTFALGGWSPKQNYMWEALFPGIALGSVFATFYFNSRAFILWGTLFLMIYILKITGEYFTDSLGWPLALVIAGLSLIGIGFMAFKLNEKLKPSQSPA